MPYKNPPSGGARAVAKKNAERAVKRGEDYGETWAARYRALGSPPSHPEMAHEWLARVGLVAVEECILDMALPAEQRREQIGRLIDKASKALDPAKLVHRIGALEEKLSELLEQRVTEPEPDAPRIEGGAPSQA